MYTLHTHNYPFIFRQLETDCSTNYLIKDPPTKVGKKSKFSVTATLLLCVTDCDKICKSNQMVYSWSL